jgi:hypothetical protein
VPWSLAGDFDSDGDDFDKYIGTVNWYQPREVNLDDLAPYVAQIKEDLQTDGILIEVSQDTSESRDANVLRIKVLHNQTAELEHLPELRLSQSNAVALLEMLGIPFDYSGSIPAGQLRNRVREAYANLDELVQKYEKGYQEEGNFIDFGRSREQIMRYLQSAEAVANYALTLPNATVTWA